MSSIYICYDSFDIDKADKVKKIFDLENIGLKRAEEADIIFYVFTENSMKNEAILEDLGSVLKMNKKFITLQYTDKDPTEEISYFIATTQWHDMRNSDSLDKLLDMVLKELR